MFFYQPILNTLGLEKDKSIDYVISWKSKGKYTFELTPLYTIFLNCRTISGYKTEIKFDNRILVVKENNYVSKIVDAYIVYD